jgi:hypothetical protein
MLTTLADNNFGDTLGDGVAGPLGLLIIVLMVIATILLIRNMNARLRRLPDHFPDPVPPSRRGKGGADGAPVDPEMDAQASDQSDSSAS